MSDTDNTKKLWFEVAYDLRFELDLTDEELASMPFDLHITPEEARAHIGGLRYFRSKYDSISVQPSEGLSMSSYIEGLKHEIEEVQKRMQADIDRQIFPLYYGPISPAEHAWIIAAALVHASGGLLPWESWGEEEEDEDDDDYC
jgi:hypothetical protein